jgi:hypothetical protein
MHVVHVDGPFCCPARGLIHCRLYASINETGQLVHDLSA